MDFTYYTSDQTTDQLKASYRMKMQDAGWRERDLLAEINKKNLPGLSSEKLNQSLGTTLYFEKNEGEVLIITFLPKGAFRDDKTRFTVCQQKAGEEKTVFSPEELAVPELVAKPKKNVFPVYPGSALVLLAEEKATLKASYFTQDNIEPVIEYYKTKMLDYGWGLVEQKPVEKIDSEDLGTRNISSICPTCAESAAGKIKSSQALSSELGFSNPRGDMCNIGVSQVTAIVGEKGNLLNMTTISINYNEKNG
jgi:hypothetical protein